MIANGGMLVEPHLVKSIEEPRGGGEPPVVLRPYTPKPRARSASTPRPSRSSRGRSTTRPTRATAHRSTCSVASRSRSPARPAPPRSSSSSPASPVFATSRGGRLRPYDKPEIAVCALIENGGHGGTAAAPVALQVFEKYFNVEPGSYSAVIQQSD